MAPTDEGIPSDIPDDVQSWMQSLRKVGLEPFAELVAGMWVVTVTTEHAAMRLDLKRSHTGRWVWADSILTVDGEPRPRARDAADLARIFRQANGERGPDQPVPIPPLTSPVTEATPYVQQEYRKLVRAIGDRTLLGGGDGHWVIGFDTERVSVRVVFRRRKGRRWTYVVEIIIDGWDRSDEVDDLAEAMALIPAGDRPDAPKTLSAPAGPARRTPAETRKGTVMRN